jgi:A/G-specific adenine glycosylase
MLQQTQVATVVPYFERFLSAFPTIEALAEAPEEKVLGLWEGLGYYRRARQLHRAAKTILREHGGCFPHNRDAVLALPGIGRYTAGAVLSIALDAREPILEANTVRLYSRLLAYRGDPLSGKGQQQLWGFAESVLPAKNVGEFNQALMELGSLTCTPREPNCDQCPVAVLCPTCAQGLQSAIPIARPRTKFESVQEVCVVVRRDSRVLLRRCGSKERWAGLWDFPRFPFESDIQPSTALSRKLVANVRRLTGVTIVPGPEFTTIKHGVTRFRITLVCYQGSYKKGPLKDNRTRWVQTTRLSDYPLSATGRKIATSLQEE